jgi:hypothetical protein
MESWSVRLTSPAGIWWWIALVLALGLGIWTYFRLRAPVKPGWLWVLRSLRIAALVLLLLTFLQPVLSTVESRTGPPPLLVLVDASGSMNLPVTFADSAAASRLGEARRLARRLQEEGRGSLLLRWAAFSSEMRLVEGPDSLPREGRGPTALGDVLEQALGNPKLAGTAGILLLTDGVSTAGKDPVVLARNSPVPIYAVTLGDSLPPTDLIVRSVQTNPEAVLGEALPFLVTLESWGLAGRRVRVEILRGEQVVASKELEIRGRRGEAQDVRLEVRPRKPGLALYRVRATVRGAPEALVENNERLAATRVRSSKRRLLYVEPHPGWDFTFIKRTLDADSSWTATYLVQTLKGRWQVFGDHIIQGWPAGPEEWGLFSAVLLDGAEGLDGGAAASLRSFVERGGGLLLLAGASGWDPEELGALRGILPVAMGAPRRRGSGPRAVVLTAEGQLDPLVMVTDSPFRNVSLWKGLPPVWPQERVLKAKAGARVLVAWEGQAQEPEPVFAVAGYGQGRVAVLTARGIWRWFFLPRSLERHQPVAEPFLRQTVSWLMEPSTQDRLRVVAGRLVYQDGEEILLEAQLRGKDFQPLAGARVEVEVLDADGQVAGQVGLVPATPPGRYQGRLSDLSPGRYTFRAKIRLPDGSAAQREGVFWVEPMGAEAYRTWSDPASLRRLAAASGGGLLGRELDLATLRRGVEASLRRQAQVREADLWNHWIWFALFVLLLGTEWFLRRRRGLA